MLNRVKRRLHTCGEREIRSRVIGGWVMDELRELDEVAYVRFASVYHHFQDVDAFREEIERLQREGSGEVKRRQLSLLTTDKGKAK